MVQPRQLLSLQVGIALIVNGSTLNQQHTLVATVRRSCLLAWHEGVSSHAVCATDLYTEAACSWWSKWCCAHRPGTSSCAGLQQVPIAELEGLSVEMEKLNELESIKEEWQLQAEAQDEVGDKYRQFQQRAVVFLSLVCTLDHSSHAVQADVLSLLLLH